MEYDHLVGNPVNVRRVSEHTTFSGMFRKFDDVYLVEIGHNDMTVYKCLLDNDVISREGRIYIFSRSSSPIT